VISDCIKKKTRTAKRFASILAPLQRIRNWGSGGGEGQWNPRHRILFRIKAVLIQEFAFSHNLTRI
jgi:hypothetical protein